MRKNSGRSSRFALVVTQFVVLGSSLLGCKIIHGSGQLAEEERDIGTFDRIVVESETKVQYEQMAGRSLTVEAEDNLIDRVVTRVRDGALVIGTKSGALLDPTLPINVRVSGPDLGQVSMSGSGTFSCETLEARSFGVHVGGSGSIHLKKLRADKLEATIAGSGDVAIEDLEGDEVVIEIPGSGRIGIKGQADTQTVELGGSGSYLGAELESDDVAVHLAGSGDVEVFARRSLNVSLDGTGDVRFKGDPVISSLIAGTGSVSPL